MTTPPRVRWGTMRPHADVDAAVRAYAAEHRISLSAAVERLCVAGLRAQGVVINPAPGGQA